MERWVLQQKIVSISKNIYLNSKFVENKICQIFHHGNDISICILSSDTWKQNLWPGHRLTTQESFPFLSHQNDRMNSRDQYVTDVSLQNSGKCSIAGDFIETEPIRIVNIWIVDRFVAGRCLILEKIDRCDSSPNIRNGTRHLPHNQHCRCSDRCT